MKLAFPLDLSAVEVDRVAHRLEDVERDAHRQQIVERGNGEGQVQHRSARRSPRRSGSGRSDRSSAYGSPSRSARAFTLSTTNVPYLKKPKQSQVVDDAQRQPRLLPRRLRHGQHGQIIDRRGPDDQQQIDRIPPAVEDVGGGQQPGQLQPRPLQQQDRPGRRRGRRPERSRCGTASFARRAANSCCDSAYKLTAEVLRRRPLENIARHRVDCTSAAAGHACPPAHDGNHYSFKTRRCASTDWPAPPDRSRLRAPTPVALAMRFGDLTTVRSAGHSPPR